MDPLIIQITKQLLLATFLGGAIGAERWFRRKPAGLRTYALVSMGACLFTVIALSPLTRPFVGVETSRSIAQIVGQIVTGVGFLGAGIIFHKENLVQGLTTAAGLWVTAAIGSTVGAQLYSVAIIATCISILIFFVLYFLERNIPRDSDY